MNKLAQAYKLGSWRALQDAGMTKTALSPTVVSALLGSGLGGAMGLAAGARAASGIDLDAASRAQKVRRALKLGLVGAAAGGLGGAAAPKIVEPIERFLAQRAERRAAKVLAETASLQPATPPMFTWDSPIEGISGGNKRYWPFDPDYLMLPGQA